MDWKPGIVSIHLRGWTLIINIKGR